MRAGGQRASLPLMRRFNEHSERLLNASLYVASIRVLFWCHADSLIVVHNQNEREWLSILEMLELVLT